MSMTRQHALGRAVAFWRHPLRSLKRITKRKIKAKTKRFRPKTTRVKMRGGPSATPRARVGSGGRHDIVPGRTIVEWLVHPELGRGRVLAFLPGRALDVVFEAGGRAPSGVPIEEVRVLA